MGMKSIPELKELSEILDKGYKDKEIKKLLLELNEAEPEAYSSSEYAKFNTKGIINKEDFRYEMILYITTGNPELPLRKVLYPKLELVDISLKGNITFDWLKEAYPNIEVDISITYED